jgi:hypothetical protein
MRDPYDAWVEAQVVAAQREYRALLMTDPNLRWADYLALSPMQRGPQWSTGGPMYDRNGHAHYPSTDQVPMGAAIEAMNRAMQERETAMRALQDQLAEVSAERDQLKAVIAGPAWGSMEAEGAEYGAWAALAQARATLVDAYQLREHAIQTCEQADDAIAGAGKDRERLGQDRARLTQEQADLGERRRTFDEHADALRNDLDRRQEQLRGMWRRARILNATAVLMNLVWLALFALGVWSAGGDWHWEDWWPWA